ncbi:MAG: hypothetical protein AAGI37_11280 [Planctomycetota bacterium]
MKNGRLIVRVFVCLIISSLVSLSVASQDKVETVSLNTPEAWHVWPNDSPDGNGRSGAPLAIEIARQSILVALRDELGLRTLDASLIEPTNSDSVIQLRVDLECIWTAGTALKLWLDDDLLLKTTVRAEWERLNGIDEAVGHHEVFSREVLPASLREAGFFGQANKWMDSAEVPDNLSSLMDDVNLITQFRAARKLHQLMREGGESPERLWALSRVYANLGQECRWFLRCQFAVFQARSLLYAKRLEAKAPDSVYASLATAYAWTLAGYPAYAEPYQARLDQYAANAEQEAEQVPEWLAWAKLTRACALHDSPALNQLMRSDGPQSAIAAMWAVFEIELLDMKGLLFNAIDKAVDVNPFSTRLLYGGYNAMGISTGHWLTTTAPEHFASMSAQQLGQIKDAPDVLLELLDGIGDKRLTPNQLAELGWAMEDLTADGKDQGELSYAVLGGLIGEANALHTVYRARFMRTQWDVDNSDYLRVALPSLARHPYKPLIHSHVQKRRTSNAFTQELMADFEPGYINVYSISLFSKHLPFRGPRFANGWDMNAWWDRVIDGGLYSSSDWLCNVRWFESDNYSELAKNADRMQWSDKHHPGRIAWVLLDPNLDEEQINNLTNQYGSHPLVATAMSKKMELAGNLYAARDHAETAAKASPERDTIERYARLELLLGNEVRWLELMKQILRLPDRGLEHAGINQTIANTYMNQGRYQESLPYAKASAGSGAEWATSTYMLNLALLGDLEKAKALGDAVSQRYGPNRLYDIRIAAWVGEIDVDVMTQRAESVIKQHYGSDPSKVVWNMAYIDMQFGQYDQALERVLSNGGQDVQSARELLFGVVAAQALGRSEVRDQLLDKLIDYPLSRGKRTRFALLADIMKKAVNTGSIDWGEAAKWAQRYDEKQVELAGNLGLFALTFPGDKDRGIQELLALARKPSGTDLMVNAARTALRRMGFTNKQMMPTGFAGHEWPKQE